MLVPLLWFLGGAVFTAALAAYLATHSDVGPWFALAAGLAWAGWLLSDRRVRTRIPALRTFPMQLRALYQAAWDNDLWKLLEERIPDEVPVHRRRLPQLQSLSPSDRWKNDAMRLLDARLELVATLLTRR